MVDKNQLYKNMSYLLINILKSDKLKANIIKSEEFKINVLLQINNLLTLEKDHDCNFDGQNYALTFAQSLVNLTEKEQTIEKQENKSVQEIENDYSFLLTYILNVYGIEKEKMSISSEINTDLIEQLSIITDQSFLKAYPIKPDSIIDNNESRQNQDQIGFSTNAFNFKNDETGQPNLNFLNFVPQHPATDPRFYPFLTKPKKMPLIKAFLLMLVMATVIANIILFIYMAFSSKVVDFNSSNASVKEFWVNNKNISQILISMPGNKDNYTLFGKGGKELKLDIINVFYFIPALLFVSTAVYVSFQIFKKPSTIREKFRIRPSDLIILLILSVTAMFFWLNIFANEKFLEFSAEIEGEKQLVEKLNDFINNFYKDSRDYQISRILAWANVALAAICLIFIFIILVINPKLDQNKLNLANEEYQKAVANAMAGKNYEFNPKLFDEFEVEEKIADDKNQK